MVVSLLLLVFLTIIGITATSNSRMESNITRNSQIYKRDFYVADSGWRVAAMHLQGFGLAYPNYPQAGRDAGGTLNGIDYNYLTTPQGVGRAVGSSGAMGCKDVFFQVTSQAFDPDGVTTTQEISAELIKLSCGSYN